MVSILRASEKDCDTIVNIGKVSVTEAHEGSNSAEVLHAYVEKNYSHEAIKNELSDPNNLYHIIYYNKQAAGFSKIVFNARRPNIAQENVAMLDKIYLLKEFHGVKLGFELLKFNIELSKNNKQSGIWLYVWTGNKRAIDFYLRAGFTIIGSYNFYVTTTDYDVSHQMFLDFFATEMTTPVLTGKHISLRPLTSSDKETFYQWATNSEATPFWYGDLYGDSIPDRQSFFSDWTDEYFSDIAIAKKRSFAIKDISNNLEIGQINYQLETDEDEVAYDIDILIAQDRHKRKGYGSEAISLLTHYLSITFPGIPFTIYALASNRRAVKAYEKSGFQQQRIFLDDRNNEWVKLIKNSPNPSFWSKI